MMNALGPDQRDKLREMQRSRIHTRDLTCAFWYDYFQGAMANPMIAYCNNRETARRAIFLRIFAADIADRSGNSRPERRECDVIDDSTGYHEGASDLPGAVYRRCTAV
jgi:hypothetical protein